MERTNDPRLVEYWLDKGKIRDHFSTKDLKFSVCQYKKGELITVPDKKLEDILFVVDGTVRIYAIREDGALSPVNQQNAPTILGDMEFSSQEDPPFFTEAVTDVVCAAVSTKQYGPQLHTDILFLHALLHSYAEKMKGAFSLDVLGQTIEERVLLYLETVCPARELVGIEGATLQLRCSRRQLQRVLSKLCADGKVVKNGKGRYQLVKPMAEK